MACEIGRAPDLYVEGDPERLAECFDELVSNAMHWMAGPKRPFASMVTMLAPAPLPQPIDVSREYTLVRFHDNGPGIPVENKDVFRSFFTTRDQERVLGWPWYAGSSKVTGVWFWSLGVLGKGPRLKVYLPSAKAPTAPILRRYTIKRARKGPRKGLK